MQSKLQGRYNAKVVSASLGLIGVGNTPVIAVAFKPYAELVGDAYVAGEFVTVEKLYWLTTKLITSGGNAGKTVVEFTRAEMLDTYGYAGGLSDEELTVGLVGKEVNLTCELNQKGYTEVKFVNPPGGKSKGLKRLKTFESNSSELDELKSLWSGKVPVSLAVDPEALFKALTTAA